MRACLPAAILAVLAGLGCGGKGAPPVAEPAVEVPARSPTAGDDLLRQLPAGADLVVEVDLARLRQNPIVGPLVEAWAERGDLGLGGEILGGVDTIAVAVYALSTGTPELLSLLEGGGAAALSHAHRLKPAEEGDPPLVAIGPAELVERLEAVRRREAASMADDLALMKVRADAMPAPAKGASVRAAGRLGFDERVTLSRLFHLDAVPVSVSVWGDVADDLAIVGVFGAGGPDEVEELVRVLEGLRERLAVTRVLSSLLLGYVVRGAEISPHGEAARTVLLVGPQRLEMIATRLVRRLEEAGGAGEQGAPPNDEKAWKEARR